MPAAKVAWIFTTGSAGEQRFRRLMQRQGIHATRLSWNDQAVYIDLSRPLIEKRRHVDSGNGTVAELQIFYLQLNPGDWLKKVKDPIDQTMAATETDLQEQQIADSTKSTLSFWFSILAGIAAVGGGMAIAYKTALSISEPLIHLMMVAREIGESGDLDQKIDLNRKDEVGELSKTFNKMIAYLKEMAAVSEAIAGGDLTLQVQPRSQSDTLGKAFSEMTIGLRQLVRSVRESAPVEIVERISSEIAAFHGNTSREDDITLVVLKRTD